MSQSSNYDSTPSSTTNVIFGSDYYDIYRDQSTFGVVKVEPNAQQDTEGIVSGMLTATETGFYTSRTNIKCLDLICEGEIEGLVSGEYIFVGRTGVIGYDSYTLDPINPTNPEGWLKSINLNETPVVSDGGLYNFQRLQAAWTNGTPEGLDTTNDFLGVNTDSSIEKSRTLNERLRGPDDNPDSSTSSEHPHIFHPKIYFISNSEIDKIRVNIKIPALKFVKYGSKYSTEEQGQVFGTSLNIKTRYRAKYSDGTHSTWSEPQPTFIEGLTSNEYLHPIEISLNSSLISNNLIGWELEVTRITYDAIEGTISNQTFIDSITEVFSSKFSFPNSSMIGMEFNAEYFSQVPTRAYDVRLLKVKVPVGYDPILKTYPETWNGKFQGEEANTEKKWTDNPAWIFYDLLHNNRYGLGKYVDQISIDKWTLYEIAKYCDELVGDGEGGVEPRFTCNVYINTREQAEKVLKDFASIFRGMIYFGLGNVHAIQDSPRETISQFTNSNVVEGNFTYASSSRKARATVVIIRYNDKLNFYKPSVEYIEDIVGIKKFGIVEKEVAAFGCTSKSQAIRLARWILYTEAYETEVVNFKCGLEGMMLRPGDLIKIVDENRSEEKYNGKISKLFTSGALLDRDLDISSNNKSYYLSINTPSYFYDTSITEIDSSIHIDDIRRSHIQSHTFNPTVSEINITKEIVNTGISGSNYATKIEWPQSTFDTSNYDLSEDATWSIVSVDEGDKLYSIVNVKEETNDFSHRIEALEHVPEKYLAIESGITYTPSDPFDPNTTAVPPTADSLSLSLEYAQNSDGTTSNSTRLVKYVIGKPTPSAGSTSAYVTYVKKGSDFVQSDYIQNSDGSYSILPKNDFLIGSTSITSSSTNFIDKFYFPNSNDTTYYFKVFSINELGIYSSGSKDGNITVSNHFPIRDVKIHSLRISTDTTSNPAGHKNTFLETSGKDFAFVWNTSYANSFVTNYELQYRIRVTTPNAGNVPIVTASTLIHQETINTGENFYNFTFETNKNSNLPDAPFRNFDVVVEAYDAEAGLYSSNNYSNSNGYDIFGVNNPRPTGYNLTPRRQDGTGPGAIDSSEVLTTEQFITSDGKLQFRIRRSAFNDLAAGVLYLSAQPFSGADFNSNGQPKNAERIAALNSEQLDRSGQYQILPVPFDFESEATSVGTVTVTPGNIEHASFEYNHTNKYYMAAKIADSFDKARRDASVDLWDKEVPIGFARYNTVDGTSSTARNPNGTPCGLCSGDQAVVVHPYRYYSAGSENSFKYWLRLNVNGQWEGNGIAAVKILTKGDVDTHYGYKGFYDYSCAMSEIYSAGQGWKPNHADSITRCRFSQYQYTLNNTVINDPNDAAYGVHQPAVVYNSQSLVTGLLVGVPTASIYTDESIPSVNELGTTIPNKTRPLKGFRRFRVYLDPNNLPPEFDTQGLASYSVIGINSWNGGYEKFDPSDPNNLILSRETISQGSTSDGVYDANAFTPTVKSWLNKDQPFENIPGLWNHHPAGFGAGFGGLKKTRYYFDVHLGRLIDDSYLNEAFFGLVTTNDYSILANETEYPTWPGSVAGDLSYWMHDNNTYVTDTL